MRTEKITIVIANYNGEEYLSTCLNSLCKLKSSFSVIIVDDASDDNSLKIIKQYSDRLKLQVIRNKSNKGAAGSRNRAIKKIKTGIVVFLDNDTEVHQRWLDELVKPLIEDTSVGATQSLIVDFDNRNKIQMAGGRFIRETAWIVPFSQHKSIKNAPKDGVNIAAITASMAVRKDVLSEVGDFDEKEAVTTEDLDLCWRIWISGSRVVLAPKSIVYHHEKPLSSRKNLHATYTKVYYHLAKNSFRSIAKNYDIKNVAIYLPQSIAINLMRALIVLFRDKSFAALIGTAQAVVWNLTNIQDTLDKRIIVQRTRELSDREVMNQVFTSESLLDIYKTYYS